MSIPAPRTGSAQAVNLSLKTIMKALFTVLMYLALGAPLVLAGGRTTLTAASGSLPAGEGTVLLDVTIGYAENPAALGWMIVLPEGWAFESITGGTKPTIAPARGTTGNLEFAFIGVPNSGVQFSLKLRHPAGVSPIELKGAAILRAEGLAETVESAPLRLAR